MCWSRRRTGRPIVDFVRPDVPFSGFRVDGVVPTPLFWPVFVGDTVPPNCPRVRVENDGFEHGRRQLVPGRIYRE
jgi:hypothetical protein